MIVADTNIFLEILLNQDSKDKCKQSLKQNIEKL
jgi:predicted nucleic-acid-binding protein